MDIKSVIGDYALFVDTLVSQVQRAGVDITGLEFLVPVVLVLMAMATAGILKG